MSSLSTLSRRLSQVSIYQNTTLIRRATANTVSCSFKPTFKAAPMARNCDITCRFSSSDGKKKSKKDTDKVTNTQHQEWVKFQQSIKIDGFETGQTTAVTTAALLGRKDRGGKSLRKRRQKEQELASKVADRERMVADLGGGEFPTMQFTDVETETLLKEAYETIPARAGPRRTRHLKRERLRWEHKRENDAKAKKSKIETHFRRMEIRSRNVKAVLAVKADADEIRNQDREYQQQVLLKYSQMMTAMNASPEEDDDDFATNDTESNGKVLQ